MADPLSQSTTPGTSDAHRRPPDPAGTRPKVDLHTSHPLGLPNPAAAAERDDRPPGADPEEAGRAGLGETFGHETDVAVLETVAAAAGAGVPSIPAVSGAKALASRVESPHASRFQFLIGALIALGICALVITVLTLRSERPTVPADWSSWRPTGTGFAAATQIANHVGSEYRLASRAQMLAIQAGPLALDGVPLTLLLRSNPTATASVAGVLGNAVLYKMCGLGPSCSIIGTPSAERLTLVRRQALELALDTFEYVANADQVVVFLPPVVPAPTAGAKKPAAGATDALFFQAPDFRSELRRPLSTTLSAVPPTIDTVDRASDTPVVKALTKPSFYSFSIVPQPADATVFLVLQPLPVS
jgi:hypothetical protein